MGILILTNRVQMVVCQGSQDQGSLGQGKTQDLWDKEGYQTASLWVSRYVQMALLVYSRYQEVASQVAFAQVGCLPVVLDHKGPLPRVELETYLETTPSVVAHLNEQKAARVENSMPDETGLSEKSVQRKTLLSKISDCSQKHKRKGCQG